jgi:hypothetical protein
VAADGPAELVGHGIGERLSVPFSKRREDSFDELLVVLCGVHINALSLEKGD